MDCGWRDELLDDEAAVYFSDKYVDYVGADILGALAASGWVNRVDHDLVRMSFGNNLSYSHGSLLLRSWEGYGIPFRGFRRHVRQYEDRWTISRELDPLLKYRFPSCPMVDSYRVRVLWVTSKFGDAIRLRYAGAAFGGNLVNVLFTGGWYRDRDKFIRRMRNLVSPRRVILFNGSRIMADAVAGAWNVPMIRCYDEDLRNPLLYAIRAVEEGSLRLPNNEYRREPVLAEVDGEALQESLDRLELPEDVTTEGYDDMFIGSNFPTPL